jgi:hypothetical protein
LDDQYFLDNLIVAQVAVIQLARRSASFDFG